MHSDPTAFCAPHFSPQKNGFSALRLNSKLQLRKCLNNPRHGNPTAESIMQNVSFASIPEQTSRPPVAVRTVPPNAPHNNSSDSPKSSPSSGMHTSLKTDAPDSQPQFRRRNGVASSPESILVLPARKRQRTPCRRVAVPTGVYKAQSNQRSRIPLSLLFPQESATGNNALWTRKHPRIAAKPLAEGAGLPEKSGRHYVRSRQPARKHSVSPSAEPRNCLFA